MRFSEDNNTAIALNMRETESCIHDGVECEYNTGADTCPCDCQECQNPEITD
jgi:pyruvate-formate lyase-activating enzyme